MKKNKKNRNATEEQEKQKGEVYTEGSLIDKSQMYRAEFLCFLPQDAIYYVNRSNLLNEDLRLVLRRMLGELNYLLYLDFQEFWATVMYNPSLRKCLESCLTYFNRRKYNQYLREDFPFQQVKDNEVAELQQHLFKTVLTLYYRILYSDQENLELWKKFKLGEQIYNRWIFDMPKLFDFMDIYGKDNRQIVQVMVNKVFEINADYKLDFKDVVEQLSKHILQKTFEKLKFINDREEFDEGANELELRKKMEVLMTLKDVLSALVESFEYFPAEVSSLILADFRLLQLCENIFYEMYNGYKNWKLGDFAVQLQPIMDSIVEDTIELWEVIFIRFRWVILNTGDVEVNKVPLKDITAVFKAVVAGFGTVLSLGSKNKDRKRNLMLLERIIDRWDIESFIVELGEDGLESKDIEPAVLEQFLKAVVGIKQIKEKRANEGNNQKEEKEQAVEAPIEEVDEDAPIEEVQQEKPQTTNPITPTTTNQTQNKPKQPKGKPLSREQQQQKKRNLARQYDDDYDDVGEYNRRMNDKSESDDTESDGSQLIQANPNHRKDDNEKGGTQQGQYNQGRSANYRGRGGRNQQPSKRGEQRHFDNPKVIEERNREPRQQRPPQPERQQKKYVQRWQDERKTAPPNNSSTNNADKKKKYREK